MDSALDAMKKAGATLVDVKFGNLEKFGDAEFEVLQFEFKDGLEKYLAGADRIQESRRPHQIQQR